MEVTSVKGGDSLIRNVTGMNRAIKDEDEPWFILKDWIILLRHKLLTGIVKSESCFFC